MQYMLEGEAKKRGFGKRPKAGRCVWTLVVWKLECRDAGAAS